MVCMFESKKNIFLGLNKVLSLVATHFSLIGARIIPQGLLVSAILFPEVG